MRSRPSRHLAALLLGLSLSLAHVPVRAEPLAVVGILQGAAVLVRQSSRFALVEGAALNEGDIVETPAGGFAQLEFDDGVIVGVGDGSRLILKPRLTGPKGVGSPRLYLLEGWLKVRMPAKPDAAFEVLTPPFEVATKSGAVVTRVQPKDYAVFVESGAAQFVARDGGRTSFALKGGDFVAPAPGGDKPGVAARLPATFVEQLPRLFRDPLPARAALVAKRAVTLQTQGSVAYADVSAWLHAEPAVRLALSRQWRGRASDRAFRAEVAANLQAHMEWERVIYPERFLPKKPPEPRPPVVAAPASQPGSPPN